MSDTTARFRQPKGVATGGQFATEHRPEAAGLTLTAPAAPAQRERAPLSKAFASKEFTGAVADFREAQDLKEYTDWVRQNHPGAQAICPSFSQDDCSVEYRLADGTTGSVDFSDDDSDPILYAAENGAAQWMSNGAGWIELDAVDEQYARAEDRYGQLLAEETLPRYAAENDKSIVSSEDLSTFASGLDERLNDLHERMDDDAWLGEEHLAALRAEHDELAAAMERVYGR